MKHLATVLPTKKPIFDLHDVACFVRSVPILSGFSFAKLLQTLTHLIATCSAQKCEAHAAITRSTTIDNFEWTHVTLPQLEGASVYVTRRPSSTPRHSLASARRRTSSTTSLKRPLPTACQHWHQPAPQPRACRYQLAHGDRRRTHMAAARLPHNTTCDLLSSLPLTGVRRGVKMAGRRNGPRPLLYLQGLGTPGGSLRAARLPVVWGIARGHTTLCDTGPSPPQRRASSGDWTDRTPCIWTRQRFGKP